MHRITRTSFLIAGAAAALSGCAHRSRSSVLPPLAPASSARAANATAADPIPDNVLAHPIIGEARRFDGAEPPPGWLRMDGRALPVAQYPQLFAIYGHGARAKTTFTLASSPGWIIAAAGLYPSDRRVLASAHRGADQNHGVSVAGVVVREPLAVPKTDPRPLETVETWYPGTMPTAEELASWK